MNFTNTAISQKKSVRIKNLLPEMGIDLIRMEIVEGLTSGKKRISSKYFYDTRGSGLFRDITFQPEYYPTRTEKSILTQIAPKLMNGNSSMEIIELGSGDCSKISILFHAVNGNHHHISYIPVDVSESAIEESARELMVRFPRLKIDGYVADFMRQLQQVPRSEKPRLICFFGSTIGNFSMKDSRDILQNLAEGLIPGDSLLVGFDLVKPVEILNAAYNDSKGITQKFNKNILNAVNNIIGSDFQCDDFDHYSAFNKEKSRVEMHLVANKTCMVNSPFFDKPLLFVEGEKIHTENSYKFSVPAIEDLIENTGLKISDIFTDSNKWFALVKLSV